MTTTQTLSDTNANASPAPAKKSPKALKAEVLLAVRAAKEAPSTAKSGPCGGCGRAYVCLGSTNDRALVNAVAAACKALGLIFNRKAHGVGNNAIYIGYDNADGRALAQSEAFAASLNANGIPCYADAHGD